MESIKTVETMKKKMKKMSRGEPITEKQKFKNKYTAISLAKV